tara:strand:+ start:213 stop:530 length:318 start_codon:yes stop_codon:yes gene_type:complete
MELRQKFIEDKGYDVEDNFIDSLQEMDLYTALKIATFLEKKLDIVDVDILCSVVLGGCVVHTVGDPITFAIEIVRKTKHHTILTSVCLVDMNEYLDLMLLDCYIK